MLSMPLLSKPLTPTWAGGRTPTPRRPERPDPDCRGRWRCHPPGHRHRRPLTDPSGKWAAILDESGFQAGMYSWWNAIPCGLDRPVTMKSGHAASFSCGVLSRSKPTCMQSSRWARSAGHRPGHPYRSQGVRDPEPAAFRQGRAATHRRDAGPGTPVRVPARLLTTVLTSQPPRPRPLRKRADEP